MIHVRIGGAVVCAVMLAPMAAVIGLAPNDRVTGPLSGTDKVGIYRAILDDRAFAAPEAEYPRRFLVDARNELDATQRGALTLWHPASWLRLDDVDVRAESPGSVFVEVLYPATVTNGRVLVQVAEMCGHRCGSGTSYALIRAGTGWRIVDQQTVVGA
jgi:hypothetical protein